MKAYAKLNEGGTLQLMGRIPNISNPTEEQRAAYAADNGYKELVRTPAPGRYYNVGYTEDDTTITEVWNPWELDAAKRDALNLVQAERDRGMNNVVIPCEALPNGILFNTESMVYALGLSASPSLEGETWTDAADETHDLTTPMLASIAVAMKTHISEVQAAARPKRDAIRTAETVDEVEAALHGRTPNADGLAE